MSRYRRKQAYRRRKSELHAAAILARLVPLICQRGLEVLRRYATYPPTPLYKPPFPGVDLSLREGIVDSWLKKRD